MDKPEKSWREVRLIGRGAQGSVHLIEREGVMRVSKRVDLGRLRTRERQAAFRECSILKAFSHPHIVQYADSFEEDNCLVLIMEWCRRGDLSMLIAERQRIDDEAIAKWLGQLASGLHYMHSRRVLHRDLKSSNIFLSADDDVKLGDFGIAKVLESTTAQADSVVGTAHYLSPELCRGQPYSYSSDLWALGCVIYELCTLNKPFDGSNLLAVCNKVVDSEPESIDDTRDPVLKQIVSRLLDKKPEERPRAHELVARIDTSGMWLCRDEAQKADDDTNYDTDDFESEGEEDPIFFNPQKEAKGYVIQGAGASTPPRDTRRRDEEVACKPGVSMTPDSFLRKGKSYKSVDQMATPPRPNSTSGFLIERGTAPSLPVPPVSFSRSEAARGAKSTTQSSGEKQNRFEQQRASTAKLCVPPAHRQHEQPPGAVEAKSKVATKTQPHNYASRELFSRSARRAADASKRRQYDDHSPDTRRYEQGRRRLKSHGDLFIDKRREIAQPQPPPPLRRRNTIDDVPAGDLNLERGKMAAQPPPPLRRGNSVDDIPAGDLYRERGKVAAQPPPPHRRRNTIDDVPTPDARNTRCFAQRRKTCDDLSMISSREEQTIEVPESKAARVSMDAARLREKLGDDVFCAVSELFRAAHDQRISFEKRALQDIVGDDKGRYNDCLEVERVVFEESQYV